MSAIGIVAILGLFAFLVFRGMTNKKGSVCGRGWVAFLMLPIAAAVMYTLLRSAVTGGSATTTTTTTKRPSVSPKKGVSPTKFSYNKKEVLQAGKGAVQALKSGKNIANLAKSYAPKLKGGALGGNVERTKSLVGYAIFLAFIQYLISAVVIMAQKPTAPKSEVFKKSFVAAGISMIFSMIFIVAVTVVANVIPVVKAVMTLATRLPFIGSFINQNFFFTMATSPLNLIGALAAHGIACSLVKEPPKQ